MQYPFSLSLVRGYGKLEMISSTRVNIGLILKIINKAFMDHHIWMEAMSTKRDHDFKASKRF